MSDVTLGVAPAKDSERDAIHVAVITTVAGEMLRPGQRVAVRDGVAKASENPHGIVDPYLTDVVPKGERFWLCLLPGSVTGMRHHWLHPDFEGVQSMSSAPKESSSKDESEAWLRSQCGALGVSFEDLVSPDSDLVCGEYILSSENEGARDHWYEIQDEFWKHHEVYTGNRTPERARGGFTCSC